MTKFTAKNVLVMRFNNKVDLQGMFFPTDCHAIIPDHAIPVSFNHDIENPIGFAKIKRKGNKLIAQLELTSRMTNTVEALRLMKLLTPSLELRIVDATERKITAIRIEGLALIDGGNADPGIPQLGDLVMCASPSTREGLH